MKHLFTTTTSAIILACAGTPNAFATPSHFYAGSISANNIAVMQHSILSTAMISGDRLSSAIFNPAASTTQTAPSPAKDNVDPKTLYGHAQMYGTAPLYGEFNDDGTAHGRSGGDAPALGSMWLAWQHFGNDTKFDDIALMDSKMDLAMLGLAGNKEPFSKGMTEWGLYAGHVGSEQKNNELLIDEKGGFFGVYKKFSFGNFNLLSAFDGGVLTSSAETLMGSDSYTNIWTGGAINMNYNIILDDTFTIQPGIYVGYTWIQDTEYTSTSGDRIDTDHFHMFEISPSVRAIKHIGNNWFGALHAKYVSFVSAGGDIDVNGVGIADIDHNGFAEYGLTIEKTIDRFDISANIGRRDGAHTGWIGGMNLKYLF